MSKIELRRKQNIFNRLLLIVIIICLNLASAKAWAQKHDEKISLNFENADFKQIMREIELKWDVVFVYNTSDLNEFGIKSLQTNNLDLYETLNTLFAGTDITYTIKDVYVFLRAKKDTNNLTLKESKSIMGVIVDELQQQLPGVYITDKQGNILGISNEDGSFNIYSIPKDSSLYFFMHGFKRETLKLLNNNNIYKVTMRSNNLLLSELLVIGYGSMQKRETTGAIQSLPKFAIKNNVGGNIGNSFEGNVAGLWASNQNYRIRGVSSINSSADPLVVIDGIPQTIGLNDINPNDIASVEFLKDAASAAIFGSRASNGVIVITTKSGDLNSKQKTIAEYRTSINYVTNKPKFIKGKELISLLDAAYYNRYPENKTLEDNNPIKYFPFSPDYANFLGFNRDWLNTYLLNNPLGTDWESALTQAAISQDVRLSFQGGQKSNSYYISLSHKSDNELVDNKNKKRSTLVLKNDFKISERINTGFNINFTLNTSKNSTFDKLESLFSRSSLLPIYAPDGSGKYFDARNINDKKGSNPLYRMSETWDDNINFNGLLLGYFDIKLMQKFAFRSELSMTPGTSRYRYFQSKDFYREDEAIDPSKSGIILYSRTLSYGFNVNNLLNYNTKINNRHVIKVMLGNNIQSFNSDFNVARFEGFPTNYFQLTNANTEKVLTRQSAGMDGYRFVSFFNRTQYALDEKYFFELNARADGTSRFINDNRWGFFPGLGMSWMLSEENFFSQIKSIDYLKFRTSYGFVGNAEVGNFPAESRVLNWAEYAGSPGFVLDRIANLDVRWEKQLQLNVGFNISALKNKISASLDWFLKRNSDLLLNYNIGKFQGYFNTEVPINSGNLNNNGFDLDLKTTNYDGLFKWKTEFNISMFNTKISKLSTQQNYIENGINRAYVGYPLGLYYLPLWAGVNPETGHEMIYEVIGPETNKTKTGKLLDAEMLTSVEYRNQSVLITDKTPYPKLYGGVSNFFAYKKFELNIHFSFQLGNWIYHNGMRQNSYVNTYDINNKMVSLQNYWTPENKNSNTPLLYNSQMANRNSTRYLMNASYLRLRNLSMNYTFDSKNTKKFGLGKIIAQINCQNLITLSKFSNGSPELSLQNAGAEANISLGNIGLNYGVATLSAGIKLEF
ncbi:MAG: TonB-dependent Receptor Plug Domain protein [Bacteroidetes bacterium ADurb.BinA395]|nr:MAG: TonB-dependent Receptor Plug Domain protein [Bacteroidetes bacterium ADurb.BinA395]